jgi:hypothetical protein
MKILKNGWLTFVSTILIVMGVAFVASSPASATSDIVEWPDFTPSAGVDCDGIVEATLSSSGGNKEEISFTVNVESGVYGDGVENIGYAENAPVPGSRTFYSEFNYPYGAELQVTFNIGGYNAPQIPQINLVVPSEEECEPDVPEPTVTLTASADCDGVISGSVSFSGGEEGSVAYVRLFHGIDGSGTGVEVNLGDELSVPGSVPFAIPSGVYEEGDEVLITTAVLILFEGEGLEYIDSTVVTVPAACPPTTTPPTTAPPTTVPPAPPVTTVPAPTPTPAPPATTPLQPNTGTDSLGGINPIGIALILIGISGVAFYFVRRRGAVN